MASQLHVYTVKERPALLSAASTVIRRGWLPFMQYDNYPDLFWQHLPVEFPSYQFFICTSDNTIAALGYTIPIAWDGTLNNLPDGWDAAFQQGFSDHENGHRPTALVAVTATVAPEFRGDHLGQMILMNMQHLAIDHHLQYGLLASVHPTHKTR